MAGEPFIRQFHAAGFFRWHRLRSQPKGKSALAHLQRRNNSLITQMLLRMREINQVPLPASALKHLLIGI